MENKKNNAQILTALKSGLVVSCQALPDEPLYRPEGGIMNLMAKAAVLGGAQGIRANSIQDIKQIKETVDVPVIGIIKRDYPDTDLYITVTMEEVDALVESGVDIIALDGTDRPRPGGQSTAEFIQAIRAKHGNILLMADISTLEEGLACAEAGVNLVGTTMCGYTPYTSQYTSLNLDLIASLAAQLPDRVKLVAEGHVNTPALARQCLDLGAHCVVVGGAITRPLQITRGFVAAMQD